MVRETRYLWVGNLPEKITEDRVIEHFERYGKIQSVKLLSPKDAERPCATVAFMDIKSASKAHQSDNEVGGVPVLTEYSEPSGSALTITRTLDTASDGSASQRGGGGGGGYQQGLGGSSKGHQGRYPSRGSDGLAEDLGNYDRADWYPTRNSTGEGSSNYDGRNRNSTTTYEADDAYPVVPERGRPKQRFTAPSSAVRSNFSQRQQHYEREGGSTPRSSQFDAAYPADKHGADKASRSASGGRSKASWGGSQSPARSDVSNLSNRQRKPAFARSPSRSGSRSSSNSSSSSRSSSSSSRSGSRRTGTVKSEVAPKKDIISSTAVSAAVGGSGSGSGSSGSASGGEPSGEKRNLGICIRGLPIRSTDTSLRDGLYHEYKKHGKVTSVSIFGQGDDRYAIVSFKKPEDATKAIEASHEKMFFGTKIHVTSHEGFEAEDDFKAPEADLDEFHPKATRTLFVGNLEKEITIPKLKDIFKPYGEIIDIDIKKQGAVSAYAFVQYSDITSVVRALRKMDGEHIGANKIKLGFGKSMPTNCVWLDNVSEQVTEKFLCRQFGRYGPVSHSVIDKVKGRGLIYFDNMDYAQHAVNEMRARVLSQKKIHIDFASRDCQTSFFEKMERTGQLRPGERPDERAGRVHRSASGTYTVRYDSTVTIATTTEIAKEVPREKEGGFVASRASRLSRGDSGDSSYTFNSPGTTQSRTFQSTTATNTRGSFTSRGRSSRSSRPGFFEGAYAQDSEFRERRQRHYEDYGQDAIYGEDTYEQELRAYGYRQQERRERGSLSPRDKRREVRADSPFSRSSRHQSPVHDGRHDRYDDRYSDRYSDRYRDTDSQSGDRESVRSYRSVRSEARRSEFRQQPSFDYPERFVEEKRDHVRGFSPTSSDYSHHSHSPTHYRSRSTSPAVSVGKERKVMNVKERVVVRQVVASSSLDDYPQSSRHSSPMDYDVLSGKIKDSKSSKYSNLADSKSKEHYPETRDSRERYGSEERTTISELIKKTRPGTYNDSEKVAAVSSKVVTKPKFDSDDDVSDMDRVSEVKDRPPEKRHSKDIVLEKDRTTDDGKKLHKHRSRSTSVGSRTRQSIPNDSDLVKYNKDSAPISKPLKDLRAEEGLKAKTKHVKSDLPRSTKTKSEPYDPFETKSESGGSDGSSSSDSGSSSDEESAVEPSGTLSSSARLQQQRQHLLSLLKQLEPASDNDSHADEDGTRKRLRLDEGSEESRAKSRQLLFEEIEQTKLSIEELDREQQREKAPKIDSSKSYRKQMEQRRLEQQKHVPASSVGATSESKAPASPLHVKMETEDEMVEPGTDLSPKDIPTEFKKKRKQDSEADLSLKTRRYRPPNATDDLFARINEDDDKKGIKEISEIKEMDKVVRDGRSSSVDTNEHPRSSSVDTSEHPSRQSSIESQDPRSPPLEYRRDPKGTLEIRTEGGMDNRDSPMDRRSLHLAESHSKKDFPMSLPLPKFARQPLKDNHAGGKNSPKSLVSPKTMTPVSAAASAGIQVKSPPFSPGGALASPLHSPALPKADTPKEASSLPNSTTATPATPKDKEMKAPQAVAEVSKEKAKGLAAMVSPGSPPLKMDSDSEVSESEPGELSLEERIRALDEKMNLTVKPPTTPSSTTLFDYREKYKIRKRADSAASSLSSLPEKSEPSDIVKSLLARTSIFDQDSKRLEQIHEKYEPKVNVTLDDPRLGGGFRTKALAKDLPLLTPTGPAPLGPQAGSALQLSPPFLGAPAGAAPAENASAGEIVGNNTNSNSSGVATGEFSAVAFPSTPQPHKAVGGSPTLPPPAASGPQSTPPAPPSPTVPPASGASTQSSAASPKLSGLDTMPQLSVAVNTPSMSPGLISRKGSLESATKSPLTPPVATTATSNIASMPSPSQTQPPQLDCQSQPKLGKKESVSSSNSSQSSTSSAPSTPVSILKKQDSNEVFSPVTPILKKEMPPLTPILKEQPSPPVIKKEGKEVRESLAGTPVSSNTPQKSSILGKRKANDDTKDKTPTSKQEKTPHKTTTVKQEPGNNSKSPAEPEAKKAKVATKEKASSSKSSSQKDSKKTSVKHSSSSSSKSPEKKHVKAEVKESTEKKKQDDKHVKHVEKSNSKERLQKEDDVAEKPKPVEPVKEKVKEPEKEPPKVKEHKEKEESISKSRDVKHKGEKVKEVKEVVEKKVEKVEKERDKKVRHKSGDSSKHREKEKTPSTDLKSKTPNDKHKDRHKVDKIDKSHKTEKHEKQDKEEKTERPEKLEKVDPRNEKTKVDNSEKSKTDSKTTKHDKKTEKQDPKLKHKEKTKEKDGSKDRKEERGRSGHDSRESSVKPEKKSTKDNEKKKDRQKDRDQEKAERKEKESEKNKERENDKSKERSDKKNRDNDSNKDKETDSSHEREKETKEEREKREFKELLELQAKFNAEEGYLTMYDKVKRRSSKEREKELAEVARQKHFSAYQVSRRKKNRQSKSEDAGSSTQNSDDESATSSSTMEIMPSARRERSESKSKSRKQRIIESSSEDEDEASTADVMDMLFAKEKDLKKPVIKSESVFESDDEVLVTPKKNRKKDQEKKEKTKKKKPQINSDTDEDLNEKHVPPSPAPEKQRKEKKTNKTKVDTTPESNKDAKMAKNLKASAKAKVKRNKVFSSDDEDMEPLHTKVLKKDNSAKKHALIDTSTTEEEEHIVMPKPKAKAKHKEKVTKSRILDSDSEDKEPEKVITPKTHKEKTKEKEKPAPSVTSTTVSEMDGQDLDMDKPPVITQTPKQKKSKDKHKPSQKKEKVSEDLKWEEQAEQKPEKPEKHKKNKDDSQVDRDGHHPSSKGSHGPGKDKEGSHGKPSKADQVLKERDSHSNKEPKSRREQSESHKQDVIEKERNKDRSHQDAIASMMLDLQRGDLYDDEPKMPNLDEDKHPLDELLKEEARRESEKKRDEKLFGLHDELKKHDSRHHNNDSLGPPEIRIKSESRSDIDVKEDQEPPKLKDIESPKKLGKKDGMKKGKKPKRKSKPHDEESTVCSTTTSVEHKVAPPLDIKEESIDQLPSLTKETISDLPPFDEKPSKEDLSRSSDIRRTGSDNIFEKMERKDDSLLSAETEVSLDEAPALQPAITSTKKDVKKEAEKLKETSQDELQRAVESILGGVASPAPSVAPRIDFPEEKPAEPFVDPLEDNPLVIEADVVSQPAEILDQPAEPEAIEATEEATVNEQDEEEARNAAAALAFLQDDTVGMLSDQTLPEETPVEAEETEVLQLPPEELEDVSQPQPQQQPEKLEPEPAEPPEVADDDDDEPTLKIALDDEPQEVQSSDEPMKLEPAVSPSEDLQVAETLPSASADLEKTRDVPTPQPVEPEPEEQTPEPVKEPEPPVVAPEPAKLDIQPTPVLTPPTPAPQAPPVATVAPLVIDTKVDPVKETKKDPYIFDEEEEPEEGVRMDILRHKPHSEPRPVLSTLKSPVIEDTSSSTLQDVPKMRSPELGSPERRIFSDSEKSETTPGRKQKVRRLPKSARGRKKAEAEVRSEYDFKDEEPKQDTDKEELKTHDNQETVFEPVKPEPKHEEKPEEKPRHSEEKTRQSPRAKEKAAAAHQASSTAFDEAKAVSKPEPDRPELKITIPLDPEAQKKVREGRKQEALDVVSTPAEPPEELNRSFQEEEPLHTLEPPSNTEDLPVEDPPKDSEEVAEEMLITHKSADLTPEDIPPCRRAKTKGKKAKDDSTTEEEEKEPGSLTMTLSLRDVQRSPSTRGRGKLEEQAAAAKKDGPEVTFSSRGRKIIPKERDGEVAPVGRKGRKQPGTPTVAEAEPRGRGRRGASSPAAAMMEPDVGSKVKVQRNRRTSKRLEKEEEAQETEENQKELGKVSDGKEEGEEEGSDGEDRGRSLRRMPKRRQSLRRSATGSDKEGVEKEDAKDESSKDSFFHDENSIPRSEPETHVVAEVPDGQRQKKGRRKRRKSMEGPSMSPRRAEVPPGSPRGKGLEIGSTSPKSTEYKPIVKLEKLSNVEEMLRSSQESGRTPRDESMRKDEEVREEVEMSVTAHVAPRTGITLNRHSLRPTTNATAENDQNKSTGAKSKAPKKDQYDFEDEEEKPVPEYPRRTKRKVVSPRRYEEISQDSAPDSKRFKLDDKAEAPPSQDGRASDDAPSGQEDTTRKGEEEKNVYLDPKTGLLQPLPTSSSPEEHGPTENKPEVSPRSDTKRDIKLEVKPHLDDGNSVAGEAHPTPKVESKKQDEASTTKAAPSSKPQAAAPVKTEPTVPPLKITIPISTISASMPSTGSTWESNMERVIEAVARGDFTREDNYDFYMRRNRRRSQDQHSPHPVPEPKGQQQPPQSSPVSTAAPPAPVVSPPSASSKNQRGGVPQTSTLHGAPQVAFPPTSYPHSTAPPTSGYSKGAHGTAHTTMAPSVHPMPQQLPTHPAMQSAHLHHAQVSPGGVKSPGLVTSQAAKAGVAMIQQQQQQQQQQRSQHQHQPQQQQPLLTTAPSVIQQPHYGAPPTTASGGINPALLHLQQSGYPVREGANEKDQRGGRQVSPAGAKPAVSSASSVQMEVVQQACSISQQEASPPGQVIEIVPNPNIMSPKPGPADRSEQPIHLPPSISQQQQQQQPQRPPSKPGPHGHPAHHMGGPMPTKEQQQLPVGVPPHMQMPHYPPFSHAGMPQQSPVTTQSSSLSQSSSLLEALNKPSKLAQQEQFLQQQRLQQQQQQQQQQHLQQQQMLRPLTPHQEQQPSPGGTFGLHRMPFTFPDQRPGISRAEPKVSQEQRADMAAATSQAQYHLQKAGVVAGAGPPPGTGAFPQLHPDQQRMAAMGHQDGRPLGYPGPGDLRFQHPVVGVPYPGGPPPGMGMGLTPRLSMDPRLMFPGTQPQPPPGHPAHPDYHALVAQGMLPQHLLPHQQPPTAVDQILLERPSSARPLSRTTPPSAQPSPRATPTPGREQHMPQPPQSLTPSGIPSALAQHPSQALNTLMKGPGSIQEVQHHADNLYMILRRYPVMWQGVLALKNDSSNVQMHYLAGSQRLVKLALPAMTLDGQSAPLRIAQRMRLEQSQLDGVHRKMQNEEEYSMLLAIPCGRDHIDIMTQTKALQSGFIQYLASKQAAGIVNVAEPGSTNPQPAYVVHIFPQCEFSHQQMADLTPDLLQGIHEISHLLIVIATVGAQ